MKSRLTLLVLSLFLTVIAADLALRRLGGELIDKRPQEVFFQKRWPPMPFLSRYEANVLYERGSIGDLSSVLPDTGSRVRRKLVFHTDEYGFRNAPGSAEKDADILLLGDSFTAGDGTSQEGLWSARLASLGHRVYGMGVPGSPWQECVTFRIMAGRIKTAPGATVVWQLFPANDLDETYMDTTDPSRLPWSSQANILRLKLARFIELSPIRQLVARALASRGRKPSGILERKTAGGGTLLFYEDYAQRLSLSDAGVRAYWSYPLLGNVMRDMKAETERRGLNLLVVLVPCKEEVYRWVLDERTTPSWDEGSSPIARGMLELCRENGLRCVDLKPEFVRAAKKLYEQKEGWIYWPDDTHWNAEGHRVAAEAVERLLKAPAE